MESNFKNKSGKENILSNSKDENLLAGLNQNEEIPNVSDNSFTKTSSSPGSGTIINRYSLSHIFRYDHPNSLSEDEFIYSKLPISIFTIYDNSDGSQHSSLAHSSDCLYNYNGICLSEDALDSKYLMLMRILSLLYKYENIISVN